MNFGYGFKTVVSDLRANKSRSLLTILGIVIGITAITLVVSVGQGAQELILDQVRAFGARVISIEPGRVPKGPSDFAEIFSDSIRKRDLEALQNPNNVQGIEKLTPFVMQNETVVFERETFRTSIVGTGEYISELLDIYPSEGIFFNNFDVTAKASVAVIGSRVKEELFGLSDALGEKIKIKGRMFRIIGVLESKGQASLFNTDDMVFVPYTTAQQYLFGINHYHSIMAQAESEEAIPRIAREIELTLRELHGIDDPEKDDFRVETQASAVETVGLITGILTALLVSVATISLVVGGVGIMNIMLVSVAERTHEIGLHKALGATNKNILFQFLLESVILTALGGIVGIFFGLLFSFAASIVLGNIVSMGWKFVFSIPAALIGFLVAALVGLVFGIYPARKAAAKSPIEALRYE